MRKIWRSELSTYNKHLAHNTFALPVLTPTSGILDWTIREIENLDIATRKILNMTGNLIDQTQTLIDYICFAETEVED